MNEASKQRFHERKFKGPRDQRPRCNARTRAGGRCKAQALINRHGKPGRCRQHGGLSSSPATAQGKDRLRQSARQQMLARWEKMRANGQTAVTLTPEGCEKRRQSARKHMRLRHRKTEAIEWADWMIEQNQDHRIRLWDDRRRAVILEPYLAQLRAGDVERFQELASIAGFPPITNDPNLTEFILARYAPRFSIAVAAEHLRQGAESK